MGTPLVNRQTDMTENITFLHYVAIGNKSHFGKKKLPQEGRSNGLMTAMSIVIMKNVELTNLINGDTESQNHCNNPQNFQRDSVTFNYPRKPLEGCALKEAVARALLLGHTLLVCRELFRRGPAPPASYRPHR